MNKQTVIINNTSPIYMTHDMNSASSNPNMGSMYGSPQMHGNAPYGGGAPYGGNAPYGHPGMQGQMGMNAGPQGMNAKINF